MDHRLQAPLRKTLDDIVECNRLTNNHVITFQGYKFEESGYGAPARYRDTTSIQIGAREFQDKEVLKFFETAHALDHDITLLSAVTFPDGSIRHMQMIDFACKPEQVTKKVAALAKEIGLDFDDFEFFDSGRSFHGYGVELLTRDEWIEFKGKLLLLNVPDEPDIVDQRWIGHRLTKGTSALRWTTHAPKYLKVPSPIDNPFAAITVTESDLEAVECPF
jgi:hypothetical protein